jgi:hypothetical protein
LCPPARRSPVDKNALKQILLRCRPWLISRRNEEAEFESAALDPELAEFRSRQEEFNARVHHELAGIPVPPTLREQIFARRKIIRVEHWKQRAPMLIGALAASITLMTAIIFFVGHPPKEDTSFAAFRRRMITDALRSYGMDTNTTRLAEVKNLLAERGRPADFSLPAPLQKVPLIGGGALTWQAKPVSMVCFKWQQQEILYMFVIDQAISGFSPDPLVKPAKFKDLSTIAWSSDGKVFLLAGKVPDDVVKQLAGGYQGG